MARAKGDDFIARQSAAAGAQFASEELAERAGKKVFHLRLPVSVEQQFLKENGKPDSLLVRRIFLKAIAEHPEWVDELR